MKSELIGRIIEKSERINQNIGFFSSFYDQKAYAYYPQSDETFSYGSSLGANLGLERVAFHHEFIAPGKRSSWPHAHSHEEELVFIYKGHPEVVVNGESKVLKPGDFLFFKSGTGWAHTLQNKINDNDNHKDDCEIFVLGEQKNSLDKVFYPEHPERNEQCRKEGSLWENYSASPVNWDQILCSYDEVPWEEFSGEKDEDRVFGRIKDFARHMGALRVAFKIVELPAKMRSSYPHAELLEEEFVYILEGAPNCFYHDKEIPLKELSAVAFPSGTGLVHTIDNQTLEKSVMIFSGELSKPGNKYFYPYNPELFEEHKDYWWENPPNPAHK
jgi:uncharacterized cupin superfamily protein